MTSLSVVIPTYNHYDLLHQSLWDLYKNCKDSLTEVLVVNDASDDGEYYKGLQWWKEQKWLPIRELRLKENQRFLRAANKGMAKATGEILVLLSNDVRVQDDMCKQISELIEQDRKVLIGNRLLNYDTGWNQFDGKIYSYLEGWLLACTAEAWKEFGGFDDDLAPHDYEDVTLSTKAISLGYSLISLDNPRISHIGGQSIGYNPERLEITNRNREIFRKKWVDNGQT